MIAVTGVFKSSLDYFRFLAAFNESELSKPEHIEQETKVNYLSQWIGIHFTFGDHVDFLIERSIKNGLLSPWKDCFTIKTGHEVIVSKYA